MPPRFPSQQLDQFLLRLPTGMREKIGAAASANNRSMTAEIISRLENSFSGKQVIGAPGDIAIPENSAATDILIEVQHQLGRIEQKIEALPKRLGRGQRRES